MVFTYVLNKINEKQVPKIESRKYISISKTVEYLSELTLQQSFLKFMQLQGVTQLLFSMVLGKLKFLKCLNGKEKIKLLKAIGLSTMKMKKFVHYGLLVCCQFHVSISIVTNKFNTTFL